MSPRTLIVDHYHSEKNSFILSLEEGGGGGGRAFGPGSVSLGILLHKHYSARFEGRKTCHLLKTLSRCENVTY